MSINDPWELRQHQQQSAAPAQRAKPVNLQRHVLLWGPVLAGMIVGELFLSPSLFGPASIGAGIGGFAGLAIGILIRIAIHIR